MEYMNENPGEHYEKEVYNIIKAELFKKNSIVSHRYPIFDKMSGKKYESDIVIIDKHFGLVVCEVKACTIENIEKIEGHRWIMKNFYSSVITPYQQAEKQLDTIKNFLNEDDQVPNYTKRAVVVLPRISREEWNRRNFTKISTPWIIFKDDLENSNWQSIIMSVSVGKVAKRLTNDNFSLLTAKLGFKIGTKKEIVDSRIYSKLYIVNKLSNDLYLDIEKELQYGIRCVLLYSSISKDISLAKLEKFNSKESNLFQFESYQSSHSIKDKTIIDCKNLSERDISEIKSQFTNFNINQFVAVHYDFKKNVMVKASAGTGKTFLMVDRVLYLLIKKIILPENLDIITFTNNAKNEFETRLEEKLTALYISTGQSLFFYLLETLNRLHIQTIHSYSKNIINMLGYKLGLGRNISVRGYKYVRKNIIEKFIHDYCEQNDLSIYKYDTEMFKLVNMIEMIINSIESKGLDYDTINHANLGIILKGLPKELIIDVVSKVENHMIQMKLNDDALEINDLIRCLNRIEPDSGFSNNYRYICIDEFQDSDISQISFIASLINDLGFTTFVVGDIKQSIYRFRGADYTAFEQLSEKLVVKPDIISLLINYRTNNKLLKSMSSIFKLLKTRDLLKYSDNDEVLSFINSGNGRINTRLYNKNDEIELLTLSTVIDIKKILADNDTIGILVRTNRESDQIASFLKKNNINVVKDSTGYFYKSEPVHHLKDLIGGLLFNQSLKYVYNAYNTPYFTDGELTILNGYDHKEVIEIYKKQFDKNLDYYIEKLRYYPLLAIVNMIIEENNFTEHLMHCYGDDTISINEYLVNLDNLIDIIRDLHGNDTNSLYDIYEWLNIQITTNRSIDYMTLNRRNENIIVSTYHKAKGLEYDYVVVPYTNKIYANHSNEEVLLHTNDNGQALIGWSFEGHKNSIYQNLVRDENKENLKESSRLLYVAMTRAKKELTFLLPKNPKEDTWANYIAEKRGTDV